ncbi:MAG: PIN domain-containing protein, partial [Treponema sp.]|nr:PIN domain-containing protein [Treponema sp.]
MKRVKVLFDLNVIIDIITKREPFYQYSNILFLMVANNQIEGIVAAGSIADIYYVVRKFFKSTLGILDMITDVLRVLNLVDTKVQDIWTAMGLGMSDFEDAIVAAVAQRENADYIVTRNCADFVNS